jgi:hypothetical protein
MNPLRTTYTRTPLHTRSLTYRGFSRSDGLWDIEGHLVDTKDYAFERRERGLQHVGDPIHDMHVRATVDGSLRILDIETRLSAAPFGECASAADPMRRLIGATLGRGWRQAIEAAIGGVQGCTHLRELLFSMATAAIQTIPSHMDHQRRQKGEVPPADSGASHYIGQCMTWRRDGPVIQRIHPLLFVAPPAPPAPDPAANQT